MSSKSILHALVIGGVIGVVIYGVAKGNFGLFAVLLIYFALYRLFFRTNQD